MHNSSNNNNNNNNNKNNNNNNNSTMIYWRANYVDWLQPLHMPVLPCPSPISVPGEKHHAKHLFLVVRQQCSLLDTSPVHERLPQQHVSVLLLFVAVVLLLNDRVLLLLLLQLLLLLLLLPQLLLTFLLCISRLFIVHAVGVSSEGVDGSEGEQTDDEVGTPVDAQENRESFDTQSCGHHF